MNITQPGVPATPTPSVTSGAYSIPNKSNTYVNTGGSATWTLPPLVGSVGTDITVKNRGIAIVTVQGALPSSIWDTAIVTSVAIPIGGSATFTNDGTYWNKR